MTVINGSRYFGKKKPKPKKTKEQRYHEYVSKSDLAVYYICDGKDRKRWALRLEWRGPLSQIPSLKNSKAVGSNRINDSARAKLEAMDTLWFRTTINSPVRDIFMEDYVSVILIPGTRLRNTDPLAAMQSIADWLEPASKPVGIKGKPRGWGIGLISDDKYVVPYAPPEGATGLERDFTEVIIRPWASVRENATNLMAVHYF